MLAVMGLCAVFLGIEGLADDNCGYYRMPTVFENTIVFTAEGDLWKVNVDGGEATRLTTHSQEETNAAFSPDGATIAFSATYHGPLEVYTMPVTGGLPTRQSFDGDRAQVRGWTPTGQIIYATRYYSDLPNSQLHLIDPVTHERRPVPLNQADMGDYSDDGHTLFFNRLPFNGSWTKRYKGGTIQQIWRFSDGDEEATPLTTGYEGTSKDPMVLGQRVYFVSDRDGTMNIWSMSQDGSDLRQHTFHAGLDVRDADGHGSRVVYQCGADLYCLDTPTNQTKLIPITLSSDFEQRRSRLVDDLGDSVTSMHLSPNGDRVVLTARGHVAVMPANQGRIVSLNQQPGQRMRDAVFTPDGESVLLLSDRSGEQEYWRYDALGLADPQQITDDADTLRFTPVSSPDGRYLAFSDRESRLWLHDLAKKQTRLIHQSPFFGVGSMAWSPDSQWLAYDTQAQNAASQIKLYRVSDGLEIDATSDRVESYSPAWSPDGQFLYFLSDRHFQTLVSSPWGPRQPEPFMDKPTEIYGLALNEDAQFPFLPRTELMPVDNEKESADDEAKTEDVAVVIATDGLQQRLYRVPVEAGNYGNLQSNGSRLFVQSYEAGSFNSSRLLALKVDRDSSKAMTLAESVAGYELSADGKKILVRTADRWLVANADADDAVKDAKVIDVNAWKLKVDPSMEWRQMLVDAWRLERDYFYDPNMHGVEWQAVLDRHLPLVERITTRQELNDLIAQLVGELSALHTFVVGGDVRDFHDEIQPAGLGLIWQRDEERGGYRLTRIYRGEPDYIDVVSPVAQPQVNLKVGDTITAINGVPTLKGPHPGPLLDGAAGQQVRLSVLTRNEEHRDVVVTPISLADEANLRYSDWEYTRRLLVDEWSDETIGYVHLRAMGGNNYSEWVRNYFPVFDRQGLIVDVRHNRGGNIDSWILERLIRPVWFYWKGRNRNIYGNMQYAFSGHMVLLMNEFTASDGEAISEGFRRLGLGKVIGTRTWGGEIWLSFNNRLADGGIASAAQSGVYGLEREWLIEGVGVVPDIVVDNLPHQTFKGSDVQLGRAVSHLKELISQDPRLPPEPPEFPVKAFDYQGQQGSSSSSVPEKNVP